MASSVSPTSLSLQIKNFVLALASTMSALYIDEGDLQIGIGMVQAADSSIFKTAAPALRGPVPRLARELLIDSINLLLHAGRSNEITVSGELLGALALGFDGEIGNFILRSQTSHFCLIGNKSMPSS